MNKRIESLLRELAADNAPMEVPPRVERDLQAIPQGFDHTGPLEAGPSRAIPGASFHCDLYLVIRAAE